MKPSAYPKYTSLFLLLTLSVAGNLIRPKAAIAQIVTTPTTSGGIGPFTLLSPETLNLVIYGGGFVSANFAATDQGIQANQSITQNIGLIARVTGYQLYINDDYDNPLDPGKGHEARLNFGRFQGGFDFRFFGDTYLAILGGGDVGDSDAGTAEVDLSRWLIQSSQHPLNVTATSIYNTENLVVSNEVDLRAVAYSAESYTLLAGAGGAIYAAGFVHGVAGWGGPILGLYLSHWGIGLDIQSGYGSAEEYGKISLYKELQWNE